MKTNIIKSTATMNLELDRTALGDEFWKAKGVVPPCMPETEHCGCSLAVGEVTWVSISTSCKIHEPHITEFFMYMASQKKSKRKPL